jgi:hypothetical protein
MEVDASTPVTHYDLLSKKELRKVKRYEGQMLYPHEQDSASDDDSSDEETDIDTDNEEEQRLQLKDMEERIGLWNILSYRLRVPLVIFCHFLANILI